MLEAPSVRTCPAYLVVIIGQGHDTNVAIADIFAPALAEPRHELCISAPAIGLSGGLLQITLTEVGRRTVSRSSACRAMFEICTSVLIEPVQQTTNLPFPSASGWRIFTKLDVDGTTEHR